MCGIVSSALLASLLLAASFGAAAATQRTAAVIRSVDVKHERISVRLADSGRKVSYTLDRDTKIVTPAGKVRPIGALHPGEHITLVFETPNRGDRIPLILHAVEVPAG